jgi:aryl-alcohol dehydrogenase-like predicted oxidoreductase
MQRHWHTFDSIEHYNDVLSQHFAPRLNYVAQYIREHGTQAHVDWYASYMADARALLQVVGAHYSHSAQERSNRVRNAVGAALGDEPRGSLSSIALRMLLGVEGVTSALVGMRRDEYVDDVLSALRAGPLGDEKSWRKLDLAEAFSEER